MLPSHDTVLMIAGGAFVLLGTLFARRRGLPARQVLFCLALAAAVAWLGGRLGARVWNCFGSASEHETLRIAHRMALDGGLLASLAAGYAAGALPAPGCVAVGRRRDAGGRLLPRTGTLWMLARRLLLWPTDDIAMGRGLPVEQPRLPRRGRPGITSGPHRSAAAASDSAVRSHRRSSHRSVVLVARTVGVAQRTNRHRGLVCVRCSPPRQRLSPLAPDDHHALDPAAAQPIPDCRVAAQGCDWEGTVAGSLEHFTFA